MNEFEQSFSFACPKFLSPVPPNYDNPNTGYHKEAFSQQQQVFMEEVLQQRLIPIIRSYLKLYTTLPISKLAAFMDRVSQGLCQTFLSRAVFTRFIGYLLLIVDLNRKVTTCIRGYVHIV